MLATEGGGLEGRGGGGLFGRGGGGLAGGAARKWRSQVRTSDPVTIQMILLLLLLILRLADDFFQHHQLIEYLRQSEVIFF